VANILIRKIYNNRKVKNRKKKGTRNMEKTAKTREIIMWILIVLSFLLAIGSPSDSRVGKLESDIQTTSRQIERIQEVITSQNQVLLDHEDTLKVIKICNPYCGF